MSDEERIAKLQKLLDRVLTRADSDEVAAPAAASHGEATQVSEAITAPPAAGTLAPATADHEAVTAVLERVTDPSAFDAAAKAPASTAAKAEPPTPAALGSGSRLVTAQADAEELTEDDLVPASSESPDLLEAAAVPLVRRSRRPADEAALAPLAERDEEQLSDGRIAINLADVQIAEEHEQSLAEQIADEEVHSGELEEEAPISSRRPIDTGTGPHESGTAPPESGKQVTAALHDAPPSGARKSTSPPSGGIGPPGPDVIRAPAPPVARVALITAPAVPRPPTFGELLDRALDL